MKRKITAAAAALAVIAGIGNIVIYGESTATGVSLYESVAAVLSDVLDKSEEEAPKETLDSEETEETEKSEKTEEPKETIKPEGTEAPKETVKPEETV
ncbi:MAG: hypothetical protein Q4G33_08315, partial [bacterium]|nr:hypothetical protein [bacterium]